MAKIPDRAMLEVGRVMKHGAEKYDKCDALYENNWRKGISQSDLLSAMERHLRAYKHGETFDKGEDGSGLSHLAHVAANALMAEELRHIFPEGDDRDHEWRRPTAYVLDIDGVLCDFLTGAYEVAYELGLADPDRVGPHNHRHWQFPFDSGAMWGEIYERGDEFWLDLPARMDGRELPVEPFAYLTHRECSTETTREWLFDHHFPNAPVWTVNGHGGKADAAYEIAEEADDRPVTFIDDRFENFRAIENAGFHCLLYDRLYNRRWDVGDRRIDSLNSLTDDPTY